MLKTTENLGKIQVFLNAGLRFGVRAKMEFWLYFWALDK